MTIVIIHMHNVLEPIDGGLCEIKCFQSFKELLTYQLFFMWLFKSCYFQCWV